MNIKAELCEIFDSHNIIYNTSTNYISCKSDTYRIYTIEEHELLNYSWDKVPKNYFLNISKHNETLGIQTVWIKSFEYSIERKKNTLISSILADLGIIETRYYARNCIISEIESYEAQKFFYVDYDKKIGNSMEALGYKFTSYSGFGFHNYCLKDCIFGKKGDMFMRKPHKHQQVVECRKKGEVVAISNSGTKLFLYTRPTILG